MTSSSSAAIFGSVARVPPVITEALLDILRSHNVIEAWVFAPTPGGEQLANRANAAVEVADSAFFSALGQRTGDFVQLLHVLDPMLREASPLLESDRLEL